MSLLEQMPRQCMQVRGVLRGQLPGRQQWRQASCSWAVNRPRPACACTAACLPACLQEQRGERLLVACSLLLAGLQAACTYAVWAAAVGQAREQHHRRTD